MRTTGSPSWQLTEAEGDRAHVLLYIRDVAALEVSAEVDAPPRLVGLPPHHSPVWDDDLRRRAGREWAQWWRALLEVEGREQSDADDDASFWAWAEDLGRVWDAPEFPSLADRRDLREVTLTLYPEARRWVDAGPSSPSRLRGEGHFPWATVRDTAEGVAAERGVSPGEVRGRVVVLDVESLWWRRVAPGTVLCSTAATEDPAAARAILRDAFGSGLA
ncbi:hypothetical protein ACI79D_02925 [Geodermatophilus sp. SYSU D00708]